MFIIGTAGHIDHGKSALVQALTGINPDRLPEEQKRGMTLDLGFAYLPLSTGEVVGIVDVPGHKDLVKHAIAGLWGIDAVLLVVAADDGWMPQSEDHLRILDLFHIKHGIVVLNKMDLVQPDWLDMVEDDIKEKLKGTRLADAPIVRVNSRDGTNIDLLKKRIEELISHITAKRDVGKPRLPIDRVFTVKGSGTVVTGTLIDGVLAEGETIFLYPENVESRIRTLETYKEKTGKARPGTRVALNLVGLEKQDIQRGDIVFGQQDQARDSRIVDVSVELIPQLTMPLKNNTELVVYLGTREIPGRIVLLEGNVIQPGQTTFAQFRFKEAAACRIGDHFIIRKPTETQTLGGGTVLDPVAGRHRAKEGNDKVVEWLKRRVALDLVELILSELDKDGYVAAADLLVASPFSKTEIETTVQSLSKQRKLTIAGSIVVSSAHWQEQSKQTLAVLTEQAASHPMERGLAQADLQARLQLPKEAFDILIAKLVNDAKVVREGSIVTVAGHKPTIAAGQEALAAKVKALFEKERTNPPTRKDLATLVPGSEKVVRFLCEQKVLVELPEGVLLQREHYESARQQIIDYLKDNGNISIPKIRELLGLTRKYILPLVNKLDEEGVTRRDGDDRVLVERP